MSVILRKSYFAVAVTTSRLFSACIPLFSMGERLVKINELESMSKEQLISKVIHFQCLYRQLLNQRNEDSPKVNSRSKKQRGGDIDFKSCNYRRIALKFAYLGWDYSGLQANPHLTDTVENILREAIWKTKLAAEDDPLKFSRCGRTDKGVSAFQQVITVRVRTRLNSGPGITKWVDPALLAVDDRESIHRVRSDVSDEVKGITRNLGSEQEPFQSAALPNTSELYEHKNPQETAEDITIKNVISDQDFDFVMMLNRVLPAKIRILAWAPVEDETFSARHDCIGREYRYFFPKGNLNIEAMNDAAKLFCGLHDFRNLGKLNVMNTTNFVRRIDNFEIQLNDNSETPSQYSMCYAKIMGSGFVYHQVRSMMTVLYLIGAGLEKAEVITELLDIEKTARKPSYGLVDATPLVLYQTYYNGLNWKVSKEALVLLVRHIRSYWCDTTTKACLSRELIHCVENDTTISLQNCKDTYAEVFASIDAGFHGVRSKSNGSGLSSNSGKPYRKIMDRPAGCSLEEKIDNLERKRQRLSASAVDCE